MKAEIMSIGTELLLGEIVDTNTPYLANQLSVLGIDLYFTSAVGDNSARLLGTLKQAWDRSDIILTTGGRYVFYYHSSHRNIPSLRKRMPDPELQIHPETARALDVEDGEWVYLSSPRSRIEIKARYFDGVDPRVVHSPHGFWYGVEDGWKKININMVTNDEPLCPASASVPIKALICRVEKMEAGKKA